MPCLASLAIILSVSARVNALTPSGAMLSSFSVANYADGGGSHMPSATSNTVSVTVSQVAGTIVTPATATGNAQQGDVGYIPFSIHNNGNGSDTFLFSVSGDAGWTPKLIYDSNGDGVHQAAETTEVAATSSLNPGAEYSCFVSFTAPSGVANGDASSFTVTAKSSKDSSVQSQGVFTATAIVTAPSAYIRSWLTLGYFTNTDQTSRLPKDYLNGESNTLPHSGLSQAGSEWLAAENSEDYLDLKSVYGPSAENCVAYTSTYIYSPVSRSAQLWVGSDDGIKIWLNGQNVWTKDVTRGCVPDQDKALIELSPGWNIAIFKVSQSTSLWKLQVKVCDANGDPIDGVVTQADPDDVTIPAISGVTVTGVTTTSATIRWTTDEVTTGAVGYGTTSALAQSVKDTSFGTQHSVTLSGLNSGTKYYFAAQATDPSNNASVSPQSSLTTTAVTTTSVGYIKNWLINGYYANSTASTRLSKDYLGSEAFVTPKDGAQDAGKTWTFRQSATDYLDFLTMFKSASLCAGYAATYVYSPTDQPARLWMGSDDGIKVWLNGQNVWTKDVVRGCVPNQDKASVQLMAGWNRLLFKVSQGSKLWKLQAKVCNSLGTAIPGVCYATSTGDTDAPVISDVQVTAIGGTRITVSWKTDKPATTEIAFHDSSMSDAMGDSTLVTDHAISMIDLEPKTSYTFKVTSSDVSGNTSEADGFSQSTTGPTAAPYIADWITNGFYKNTTTSTRLTTDYLRGEAVVAPVPDGVKWIPVSEHGDGYVNLADVYGNPTYGASYAHVYFYSPATQPAQLWMGSNDGLKVYLNGKVIWTKDVYRSWIPDQDRAPAILLQGWNRMLVKISQGTGAYGFSARLCDSNGYEIPGLEYYLDPSAY